MKKQSTVRTRNFATVVYPDSVNDNWQDILIEQRIPCFISPLHNMDTNPYGEPKKAHYHILLMFDSVKTQAQAKEVFDLINGVGCEIVKSIRGYARYLCHLDNPEKYQYNIDDVRSLFGADYNNIIGLVSDKYLTIREIITYCVENHIYRYDELFLFAMQEKDNWYRCLCDNGTYVVKEFLKSRYWAIKEVDN